MPPGCGTASTSMTSCGSRDRDRERLELVVAVVAQADDAQRERELRVGRGADATQPARAGELVQGPTSSERAAQARRSRDSARASRSMPAAASTSTVRSPRTGRSDRRSVLRRCAKPARTSVNMRSGDDTSTGGAATAVEAHQHRLDLRPGHEHRRGHRAHDPRLGVPGDADRHRARGAGAGCRRQALPHLALDHHEHARDLRDVVEESHDDGRGDVVGQVRHARPLATGEPAREVESERVALLHRHVRGVGDDRLEHGHESSIDLDGEHRRARRRERERERPETGPDLEHAVGAVDLRQARDPSWRCSDRRGSSGRARDSAGGRALPGGRARLSCSTRPWALKVAGIQDAF